MEITAGLCDNRHTMPPIISEYVYDSIDSILDFDSLHAQAEKFITRQHLSHGDVMNVYVTGATPAFAAIISSCFEHEVSLNAWHYDKNACQYLKQEVLKF